MTEEMELWLPLHQIKDVYGLFEDIHPNIDFSFTNIASQEIKGEVYVKDEDIKKRCDNFKDKRWREMVFKNKQKIDLGMTYNELVRNDFNENEELESVYIPGIFCEERKTLRLRWTKKGFRLSNTTSGIVYPKTIARKICKLLGYPFVTMKVSRDNLIGKTKNVDEKKGDICSGCLKQFQKLNVCAQCKNVKYCSTECQKMDWTRRHKIDCKKKKKEETIEVVD